MCSVFSQALVERWKLRYKTVNHKNVPHDLKITIKDVIKWYISHDIESLRYVPQVLCCRRITTLDYIAEDATYKICTCKEVRKVITWICVNLLVPILTDRADTRNVKIRIAVDMLNKLENQKIITKDLNLFYFDNVVSNIQDLWWDIVADDHKLPF